MNGKVHTDHGSVVTATPISSAIGDMKREFHTGRCDFLPSESLILCSDGMWEYLRDEEILVDCLKAKNAKEWAELLLLRAVARIRPGNDNLSLITVMLQPDAEKKA